MELSRRNFLKSTGVLSIAAIAPLSASAASNTHGKGVLTAAHWGTMYVQVKDGKIISSIGAKAKTIENSLQTTAPDQAHTKARIKYPMVRKGYLESKDRSIPDGKRGNDEWVRVSWDEALKLVHEEHSRIRANHPASSVFSGSYGWRSTGCLHKAAVLLQRYMSMAGGYTNRKGDYSSGASQVIMPHVVGGVEVYDTQTAYPVVMEHSDVVVLWGMNPINTLKVAYLVSDEAGIEFFHELKKSGKTIIVIDPRRSETIDFLGDACQHVAPIPGSDTAMMIGMMHHLHTNKMHDEEFLNQYCEGWSTFESYLTGESDGEPKTVEWASEITGVPARQIEILAEMFHKNRTMLMSGWSMQRTQFGEHKHWTLVTLAAMLGQIGLPGGGFGLAYHYANAGNPKRVGGKAGNIKNKVPGYPGAATAIQPSRIVEMLENPGGKYQWNGSEKTFPDIRSIFWSGGATFTHHQDTNRLIDAWQKPEQIVILEPYWTPTAHHADIVLPVTTSFERNDISMTGNYSGQHLVPMKQVIEPQFEARNELDIFADLAEMLEEGGRDKYMEGRTEMQWLNYLYTVALDTARKNRVPMPKFHTWWDANEVFEMKSTKKNNNFVRFADFREDPVANPLGTPSGKIEIFSSKIASFGYEDCPPHPTWLKPDAYLGNAKADEFYALSPHPAHRLHSQLNYAKLRDQYAVADREPITIHPNDAKEYGIESGDIVRVYNQRGSILAGAVVSDKVKERCIVIHEGAWYNPNGMKGMCKNGAINVLTRDKPTSRLANAPAVDVLVKIEKYQGTAPQMTAFDPVV